VKGGEGAGMEEVIVKGGPGFEERLGLECGGGEKKGRGRGARLGGGMRNGGTEKEQE